VTNSVENELPFI